MSGLITLSLGLMLSLSAFAQDLSLQGFTKRFTLVKNSEGKVTLIKLNKATTKFSVMPFIEQIKQDLKNEQANFKSIAGSREEEIDGLLADLGLDPYSKDLGSEEARQIKAALMNIPNINVDAAFAELTKGNFWKEFERRLQDAFLYIDPRVLANLEDPRFFYKKLVTYKVIEWALEQAKKQFADKPIVNIASFVIVRIHEMMMEQRHFHHNMLLHYFETIPETKLGMTKEDVDRSVSSIYEYRIEVLDIISSNNAAKDWLNFGMNKFYAQVRAGNARMRTWEGGLLSSIRFKDIKKLNFAFASVNNDGARQIYHLHHSAHKFTKNPSLAYDYSNPKRVRRNRALLNLAGVALGFVQMPGWVKSNVEDFMKSFYVQQVRTEGALIGYFESTGDTAMINQIYGQRANFYILQ